MISFNRLNDKGTEYRLVFGNGKHIDIFLLPRKTLTNKFEIIISSIQKMSAVIGENFDKFVYCLLSDYQYCELDEYRYNFLHENLRNIVKYADFFVENSGVDYAEFANENKQSESSIFFDEHEIKKIIKLSEALKIYSLCLNTEKTLSDTYHKKLYNDLIEVLTTNEVILKIYNLLELLGAQSEETLWRYYDNLSYYSFKKIMGVFNFITSQGLIVCSYEKNPIPFFIEIFNKTAEWKDKFKEDGIIYEDDEFQNDRDDKFLFNERIHKDFKKETIKDLLSKFETKSFSFLVGSYGNQTKKMSDQKGDILLKKRINKIQNISPFWDIIIAPIFSKATGIKYDFLRKQSPKRVAVMSFYLAHLLRHLFNNKFIYLFSLAAYYPESEIPESTTYRLANISHLINSTLNFSNDVLIRAEGSRIKIVRIIEAFIGKMRIGTAKYCNILTGQAMDSIDFKQIEIETIDYLTRYFSDNLETEIQGLEENISRDIKILLYKADKLKKTKDTFNKLHLDKTNNNKASHVSSFFNGMPEGEKNNDRKRGDILDSSKNYRKTIPKEPKKMHRIIDDYHNSERKEYFTKVSSYPLRDLTGIIGSYKAQLSNHLYMYKDVLKYFNELNFRTDFTLYEQNKEGYLNLLRPFNENIIKSEAFHDAFFAFNCIEFGNLIDDYYNNKIQQQYQMFVKDLINDLEKHPTFFKRCKDLVKKEQYYKYYIIGIKRLLNLIEITKNSQGSDPIDNYLSHYNIYLNYNDEINMGDFLKKIDVAIFMSKCVENNLTISFDEIYQVYDQWRSNEKLLLYNIKEGKNLSIHDMSDNRPHKKLPNDTIRISTKEIKKR